MHKSNIHCESIHFYKNSMSIIKILIYLDLVDLNILLAKMVISRDDTNQIQRSGRSPMQKNFACTR